MTSRERVLTSLNFGEPDRVPIDLGSNIMSGIMAHALDRLRRHLGLAPRPVKVFELFQMLGEVEMDVVDRLGADILPVEPLVQFFGVRRENWKPWQLWDGTRVLVPGQFDVEVDSGGGWLLHTGGNPANPVEARMPNGGFYFDMPGLTTSVPGWEPPPLAEMRREHSLGSEDLEFLQARAEHLRATTDKALMLGAWDAVGLPWLGSIPDFLMLMASDKASVKDLFAVRTEVALANLEKLAAHLGDSIDIIGMDGTDYGSQNAEMIAPALFEELCIPYYSKQNAWVHNNTGWKTWYHSCGSITRILPMLIDAGVDIINPVQTSAAGMDPGGLKQRFGGRVVFWGGGVDTQRTLPFASPEEVAAQVRERIRIFAPGGGFVFNPIHNIQQGTPPENIVAAFDAARTEPPPGLQ
jgi:hypothetical protein